MKTGALVLCNGEPPPRTLLRRLAAGAGLTVAADGGANAARAAGLRPDLIIGDLDSITAATRRALASSAVIRVGRQDNTDLEKALDVLVGRGVKDVVIAGATGKRLDMTLANISVAWRYRRRIRIRFVGAGWEALPVHGRERIRAARGTTVSLIPFSRCTGITLRGLRYPMRNGTLSGGAVAVSNVVVRSPFSVRLRHGRLLLVLLHRKPGG